LLFTELGHHHTGGAVKCYKHRVRLSKPVVNTLLHLQTEIRGELASLCSSDCSYNTL